MRRWKSDSMELYETSGNPVPAGAEVTGIASLAGGTRLRAALWQPAARQARGTICLMQGRSEFIEKYFEVISELRQRGFAVCAFDWRGQGGSERLTADPRKGHAGRFDDYAGDLSGVLEHMIAKRCPQPYFGLAHSMGGAALLIALRRGEKRIARAVLTSPMARLHESQSPPYARFAAELLSLAGLRYSYIPGGGGTAPMTKPFEGNILTSDPERYARAAAIIGRAPRIALGDPTIGWIRAAYRAMAELRHLEFGFEFVTPLLFVNAGADTLVSAPAAAALADRVKGASSVTIAHSRHEILMERDPIRREFWAAFDAFLPGERAMPRPRGMHPSEQF